MIRILHTGDLHLGREYKKQEQEDRALAARYRAARMEALETVVRLADEARCDYLVVAGDLFDSRAVPAALQREAAERLAACGAMVLVLPGNHDFCEGADDRFWSRFAGFAGENTVLLTRPEPLVTDDAVFYPCPCTDRYAETNALGWLKADPRRDPRRLNVGVAHGALEGLSYDREKRYYSMTRGELEGCSMELWLLGHSHMPYPERETMQGERIFNAGTHQQTDVASNAEGSVFLIEADGGAVSARRVRSGAIRFVRRDATVEHGQSLRAVLEAAARGLDAPRTTLRVELDGVAAAEEYPLRQAIYDELAARFLKLEIRDDGLRQEITAAMIDAETLEGSLENRLLKGYLSEPELLELAYALVRRCGEGV